MIGEEDHYISFDEAFQNETTERQTTSLKQQPRRKSLPFTQHAKNIALMLQCEECDLCSKQKLSAQDKTEIQSVIDDISYTCGTTLQELDLPEVHT